jgi:ABC-type Fe3+ transport system substrate-binding protein
MIGLMTATFIAGDLWAKDIDPALVARAKKEGEVTFYTNLIVNQVVRPVVEAFEKKYGIKVNVSRADSQATILKLVNEARAGRMQTDVWNLSSGLKSFIDAGVVAKFDAVNAVDYPPSYKDANKYWVATNVYVLTPGYNTNLVPANEVPKTYEDLLNPKWKGKLVWKPNDVSGATGFISNILASMGEEKGMAYLRRLAKQDINTVEASARAILDRVISGEYPIALQIFNHHTVISASKGAPAAWIAMEPVTLSLQLVGITKGAPHPNAALLFIEYMLSEEGQKIFQDVNYLPAHPKVPAQTPSLKPEGGGFKATVFSPEMMDEGFEHWAAVFNQLFR